MIELFLLTDDELMIILTLTPHYDYVNDDKLINSLISWLMLKHC